MDDKIIILWYGIIFGRILCDSVELMVHNHPHGPLEMSHDVMKRHNVEENFVLCIPCPEGEEAMHRGPKDVLMRRKKSGILHNGESELVIEVLKLQACCKNDAFKTISLKVFRRICVNGIATETPDQSEAIDKSGLTERGGQGCM